MSVVFKVPVHMTTQLEVRLHKRTCRHSPRTNCKILGLVKGRQPRKSITRLQSKAYAKAKFLKRTRHRVEFSALQMLSLSARELPISDRTSWAERTNLAFHRRVNPQDLYLPGLWARTLHTFTSTARLELIERRQRKGSISRLFVGAVHNSVETGP